MKPALSQPEVAAIKAVNSAYPRAWEANDADAVMTLFTEDAVLMPHHGASPVEGLSAIREHFWPSSSSAVSVTEYLMLPEEIDGCDRLAYSRGTFSITFRFEDEGEVKTASNDGNYLMIFRKRRQEWRIARFIWNDPLPEVN